MNGRSRMVSWMVALIVGAACAGAQPRVKPDDMSAADHREAARHERDLAQQNATMYDPGAVRVSPLAPPAAAETAVIFPASVYNPTEGFLREADKHRARTGARTRVDAIVEHMRCHYAYARSHAVNAKQERK